MPDFEQFLIVFILHAQSLGALGYMLRYTDGPGDIFRKFRISVGILPLIKDDGSEDEMVMDTFFAKWYACHWCFTTWYALFSTFSIAYMTDYWNVIWLLTVWLSLVMIACLMIEVILFLQRH